MQPDNDLLQYLVVSETQIATEDGKQLSDIPSFKNFVFIFTEELDMSSFLGDGENEKMVSEFIQELLVLTLSSTHL